MHFQSRVFTTTVHELLFADDCDLNITLEEEMQRSMDLFSAACENFGLVSNTQKSVVMHQPPSNTTTPPSAANQLEWNPTASDGELPIPGHRQQDLENQSSLRPPPKHSLESSRSPTEHEAKDVQGRHTADAAVRSGDLDSVHKAGTPTEPLPPQLSSSHPEAEVARPNPDTDVLERTRILSIYAILKQMQLLWSGHLVRMDDEWLPKRLVYGDVVMGSRRQGGQIHRYRDTLKSYLKRLKINQANWEELARDLLKWRTTVKMGAAIYEANRIAAAKVKREARKSQLRFFCVNGHSGHELGLLDTLRKETRSPGQELY
nr:unnamed protein product [Spirometra erinaceieuropaei]